MFKRTLSFTAAAALLAFGGAAAAQGMPQADYNAAKTRVDAEYKADKARCDSLSGNVKDICEEEAKGKEKVAKAELDYKRSGKPADMRKLEEVKADAAYEIAEERCDDQAGNAKDVCVQEAKAVRAKAMASAMKK